MSKVYAVIVAAGKGTRMGEFIPKQFIRVANKPIIEYTIKTFYEAVPNIEIVVVCHRDFLHETRQIGNKYSKTQIKYVPGGNSRFESVKIGLDSIDDDGIVLVHDGVRCMVTAALINNCVEHATANGSAVPVLEVTDSLRQIDKKTNKAVDRAEFRIVQTPQAFNLKQLKKAFAITTDTSITDEATVYELAGNEVQLINGEATNIKITYPKDIAILESSLK
jgi:2-C-methyl-D-erythritol 4-phosphate cytidylyltransferase